MTIAHVLTFFRIFVSPVFLFIYAEHEMLGITPFALPFILLALLAVSEMSDAFDGYFARRYNQVSDVGKVFDPMADSIYRLSVFLTFTLPPVRLPILILFLFLYRDSAITTLRTICAIKGRALAARPSGKIKAILQAMAAASVLLLMIPHAMGLISSEALTQASTWIVGSVAAYTLLSGVEYLLANRKYLQASR